MQGRFNVTSQESQGCSCIAGSMELHVRVGLRYLGKAAAEAESFYVGVKGQDGTARVGWAENAGKKDADAATAGSRCCIEAL